MDVGREHPPQDVADLVHGRGDVEDPRVDHFAAAEGQQLLRQIARALAGLRDFVQVREPAAVGRQVLTRQVGEAENRLEQVVEVVRDAAGQLPDRLQLAALRDLVLQPRPLLLGALPLGDVPRDQQDAGGVAGLR